LNEATIWKTEKEIITYNYK